MEKSNSIARTVGTFVLGGLVVSGAASVGRTAPASKKDDAARHASAPEQVPFPGGIGLLGAYVAAGPAPAGCADDAKLCYDFDALIASVPDPFDSHLDWAYDTQVEAVRRALEHSGYVLDRFWTPWQGEADAQPGRITQRDTAPGLMLFRSVSPGKDGRNAVRLVYLVGETPRAGVHPAALRRALDDRAAVLAFKPRIAAASARLDTVRIVGPAFSGSVAPMRRVLDRWLLEHPGGATVVRVVSGSATRDENAAVMGRQDGRITYASTLHPVGAALDGVREVLSARLQVDSSHIALLEESGSAFGAAPATRRLRGVLHVSVPMNIAALRGEDDGDEAPRSGLPGVRRESSGGRMDLRDGDHPRDAPVALSGLSAPTAGVVVDELIQLLRQNDIRAVGLQFTDVRDQIFLGTRIRERLHDVQLFVLGSNALFLRSERTPWLAGTLTFSTYPPLAAGGGSSTRGRERMLFTDDAAQGTYNAALLLLGRPGALLDYATPVRAGLEHPVGPPLWVSAVGSGGFSPVTALDVGGPARASLARAAVAPPPGAARAESPGFVTVYALFAMGLGLLALSVVSLASFRRRHATLVLAVVRKRRRLRSTVDTSHLTLVFHPGVMERRRGGGARARAAAGSGETGTERTVEVAVLDPPPARGGRGGKPLHASQVADASGPPGPPASGPAPKRPLRKGGGLRARMARAGAGLSGGVRWARAQLAAPVRRYDDEVELRHVVHAGSLMLHRELYRVVRLVAGAAAVIPALSLYLLHHHPSPLALGTMVVVGAAWLAALASGVYLGWLVFANHLAEGRAWALRPGWWRHEAGQLWMLEVAGRVLVTAAALFYFGNTLWYSWELYQLHRHHPLDFSLLFVRAAQLGSGLSPIVPLMLASLGVLVWGTWHSERVRLLSMCTAFEAACLRRAQALRDHPPRSPLQRRGPERREGRGFAAMAEQLRSDLFLMVPQRRSLFIVAIFALVSAGLLMRRTGTLESVVMLPVMAFSQPLVVVLRATLVVLLPLLAALALPPRGSRVVLLAMLGAALVAMGPERTWTEAWLAHRFYHGTSFDLLLVFSAAATLAATTWGVYRLIKVWASLREFLAAIEETPLRPAMGRIPGRIARLIRLTIFGSPPTSAIDAVLQTEWGQLRSLYPAARHALAEVLPANRAAALEACMRSKDAWRPRTSLLEAGSAALRFETVFGALETVWEREKPRVQLCRLTDEERKDEAKPLYGAYPPGGWMHLAEDFVALQVVDYVQWAMEHLHKLAVFLFASLLLSTALLSSYPTPAQSLVKLLFMVVLLATVGSLLTVMLQMNRDEILSRIGGTEPGKITWDSSFVLNAMVVGVVPLLALVSSEFPAVREVLFAWLAPVLKSTVGV
jgi:hypothetical protein